MATQRDQGKSSNRGFGAMDKDKQRELSGKGGHASQSGRGDAKSSDGRSASASRTRRSQPDSDDDSQR